MNDHEQFDKEARMLWISLADENPQLLDHSIKRLAHAEHRFMKQIRSRDMLESGVAAIMAAILLPLAVWSVGQRHWWFAAAFTWGVLYAVGVIVWLWRARRQPPASPGLPLEEYRRQIVARVDAQIALLASARWWYVGPVLVFCALIYGAVLGSIPSRLWPKLWPGLAVQFILTLALAWFVVRLNEGRGLRALREERARLTGSEATDK